MNFLSRKRSGSRARRRDRASDLDFLLEARTRSRPAAPRWWVRPVLWTLLIGAVYFGTGLTLRVLREQWLHRIERLALKRIEVVRDGLLSEEEIRELAGIPIGRNALTVDPFQVRERLRRHPRIEDAQIRMDFPDGLHITVRERVPVARLMLPRLGAAETYLLVDDLGSVFLPFRRGVVPSDVIESEAALPTLLGVHAASGVAGRALTDAQALAGLRFLAAFEDSPMGTEADVIHVDVSAPPVVTVLTRAGSQVTLAADRDLHEQLIRWHSVHHHGLSLGLMIATLDLSIVNNPPLRWVDSSQPQPAPAAEPPPRLPRTKRKPHRRNV